jgi:hypothetical protein
MPGYGMGAPGAGFSLQSLPKPELAIGGGAVVVALSTIVGFILASKDACGSYGGVSYCAGISVNYYTAENAGLFAFLALLGAIGTMALIFLHATPSMRITWPLPFGQILMGAAGITAACAILVVLMQLVRTGGFGSDAPIFMWIADLAGIAGGVVMGAGAYMVYSATPKRPY